MALASHARSRTSGSRRLTSHQLWLVFFGLWVIFLSGLLSPFLKTPGVIQAVRLKHLLQAKQQQFDETETALLKLQDEANLLEKDRLTQHREIRKVLGYAAPNEMIFDFSSESL